MLKHSDFSHDSAVNDVKRQLIKPDVPYSDELAKSICKAIECGSNLYALSCLDEYPSRAAMYYWLDDKPEFAAMYARAKERRRRVYRDKIETQADLANIETVIESLDGKRSTHSAQVAAVDLSCKWLKWAASLDDPSLRDELPLTITLTTTTAADQLSEILSLAASGTITLTQADKLMILIQKKVEMTELKELKQKVEEQTILIKKLLDEA